MRFPPILAELRHRNFTRQAVVRWRIGQARFDNGMGKIYDMGSIARDEAEKFAWLHAARLIVEQVQ